MSRQNNTRTERPLKRRSFIQAAAGVVGATVLAETTRAAEAVQPFIEAYAGRLSYLPGEEVGLHVSTSATRFGVEVARVGAKREVVFSKDRVTGAKHTVPANAFSHGCGWPADMKIPIAKDWRSGYYQILLRTADGKAKGEAFFVVRPHSASPRPRGERGRGEGGRILI